MGVSLSPEFEAFVQEKVQAGEYASPSDVVSDALSVLKELPPWTLEELRHEIRLAAEQLERGEVIRLDDRTLKAYLRGDSIRR